MGQAIARTSGTLLIVGRKNVKETVAGAPVQLRRSRLGTAGQRAIQTGVAAGIDLLADKTVMVCRGIVQALAHGLTVVMVTVVAKIEAGIV